VCSPRHVSILIPTYFLLYAFVKYSLTKLVTIAPRILVPCITSKAGCLSYIILHKELLKVKGNVFLKDELLYNLVYTVGTSHNPTDNPYSFNQTILTPSVSQSRQFLLLRTGNIYSQKHTARHRYLYTTNWPISDHNSSINPAKTPIG
jgi:hypothetical protein